MSVTNLRNKLSFLRDCLGAESRSQSLWNVRTSKKIELHKAISYREFVQTEGKPVGVIIDQKYADDLKKMLSHYSREKQLIVSRFYIIAYHDVSTFGGNKRKRKVCFPLIYFPCKLSNSEFDRSAYITPILEKGTINPAAVQFFSHFGMDANALLEVLLDQVVALHNKGNESEKNEYQAFYKLFEEFRNTLTDHSSYADTIDDISSAEALKKIQPNEIRFSYESLVYVSRKQASAQGALHEIETIIKRFDTSSALAPILGSKQGGKNVVAKPFFWTRFFNKSLNLPLPVVLSQAQSDVISKAQAHNLSVAAGPPGTGKSFTIASLALKEFINGNSVLIVSQNQHAVDVVRRKLIDDFGIDSDLTVLGSDDGISREVQKHITEFCGPSITSKQTKSHKQRLVIYKDAINKLDDLIYKRELMESEFLENCREKTHEKKQNVQKRSFFSWINSSPVLVKKSDSLLSEQFTELEQIDEEINLLTAKIINLHHLKKAHKLRSSSKARSSLKNFASSLSARNGFYQERYYRSIDFSYVLDAVPFWFTSLSSLHRLLPLTKEMFDIVIIDEATQCNLSVTLPALYRSKRAVVVGDPKQLNHVSFVSYKVQQSLFDRYSLSNTEISQDFRNKSVLDYALDAIDPSVVYSQLDEHFRSHPQIIEYSNQEFYNNSLKVMTTRPNRIKDVVELVQVNGKRVRGVNKVEADAVISFVKKNIKQQSDLPEKEVQSLGVLSFFSDQAQYIEKVLFNELGLNDLRRHNLRVGTPFSFQGEERDHMIISCCVDAQTKSSSYTYLNRDDVFNVGITRARDYQTIFISCAPQDINTNSKLSSYIKFCEKDISSLFKTKDVGIDAFQDEIYTWLQGQGIKAYKNYIVAGISIDLMAVYEDRALAIDLVGFSGPLNGSLSLKQFKLLARAGLKSFLFSYDEWRNDRERLLEHLLLQIGAISTFDISDKTGVGVYSDAQEDFINKLTDGVSINQLNTRFVRSNESRAAKQISLLLEKQTQFEKLLLLSFVPQELTYKRYKNAFHSLLKDCMIKLQKASISSELATSLLDQQKQLFSKPNEYDEGYEDIFAARASMVDEQKSKVQHLLNVNEEALLQMDKTCLKLNKLYENAGDLALNSHDILNELTQKIDLYKDVVIKNDNV